jgi:hypothetical protein
VATAPPAEPSAPPETDLCPRCGTPFAAGQEYCLDCGLRLSSAAGFVGTLGRAWTRRLRWYPGDWIWPSLLGLVIAALGATVAIAAQGDDRDVLVGTTNPGTLTQPTTQLPTQPLATAPPPPPTVTARQPPPAPRPGALVAWPAGQGGYTVVLSSIPTTAGRPRAVRKARQASSGGLADVGVLDSGDFSSLHPGYYVVFSGVYNTLADARAAANDARDRGFPQAYARQIAS